MSAGARFVAFQTGPAATSARSSCSKPRARSDAAGLPCPSSTRSPGGPSMDVPDPGSDEFVPGTGNVSISANGSVVGFSNEVIDTSAPAGSLAAHARVVATNGEFGPSTIIGGLNVSPDGTTAYFATFQTANNKPVWSSWQLRSFDLATGQTAWPPDVSRMAGPRTSPRSGRPITNRSGRARSSGPSTWLPGRPAWSAASLARRAGRPPSRSTRPAATCWSSPSSIPVGHGAPADHEAGRGRRRDRAADPAERELGRRPGDRLVARPGYPGKRRLPTAEVTLSAATAPPDHAAPHRARRPSIAAPLPAISSRSASPS